MKPDIQSGGVPSWVWSVLLGVTALGSLYAAQQYFTVDEPKNKIDKTSSIFDSAIPDGFITTRSMEVEAAPEPAPAPAPAKKPKPKKKPKRPPAPANMTTGYGVAPYTPPPKVDYAAQKRKLEIEKINEMRRGSGVAFRAVNGSYGNTETEWINTDEDFTGQGVKRLEASYPVDLERTITADRFISAVLINAIHSQMEGKIVAQIDKNVYGAHGRKVLIPAGSKAVGQYFPAGKVGDTRIRAVWTRIITPDGINIMLGNANLADSLGRAGITGDVDARIWERYGVALMISTITAAGQMSVPVNNANTQIGVDTFGREMSRTSQTILENNIDLKPIIQIDAGTRIFITPLEDLWFKKPVKKTVYAERVTKEK